MNNFIFWGEIGVVILYFFKFFRLIYDLNKDVFIKEVLM